MKYLIKCAEVVNGRVLREGYVGEACDCLLFFRCRDAATPLSWSEARAIRQFIITHCDYATLIEEVDL